MASVSFYIEIDILVCGINSMASDWPEIGQIREFFRSDYIKFWSLSQNVLKSDIKNSLIIFPVLTNLTHFGAKPDITDTQRISLASREHRGTVVENISHILTQHMTIHGIVYPPASYHVLLVFSSVVILIKSFHYTDAH